MFERIHTEAEAVDPKRPRQVTNPPNGLPGGDDQEHIAPDSRQCLSRLAGPPFPRILLHDYSQVPCPADALSPARIELWCERPVILGRVPEYVPAAPGGAQSGSLHSRVCAGRGKADGEKVYLVLGIINTLTYIKAA